MAEKTVEIKNFVYNPNPVIITVGDSVKWINRDDATHTATRDNAPAFNTGPLAKGKSRSVRFDSASGNDGFEYYCIPHPSMKARVVVKAFMLPAIDKPPSG